MPHVPKMSIFKTRAYLASALFVSWGLNLWLTDITSLAFDWVLAIASRQVWAIVFLTIGIALAVGAHRSNGIKGRLANRASAAGAAVAVVWSMGFLIAWIDARGETGSGLAGFLLWSFVLLSMYVTARTPSQETWDQEFWERPTDSKG